MSDETLAQKRRRQADAAERHGDLGTAWTFREDADALDAKDARIAELEREDDAETECERLRETLANAYSMLRLIRRGINSGHIKDQTILEPVSEGAEEAPMTPLSDMIDRVLAPADQQGEGEREDEGTTP